MMLTMMRTIWWATLYFPVVTLGACKATNQSTSQVNVVGGQEAIVGQIPANVHIPNCSAVRIGDRMLLTAAHCVLAADSTIGNEYQIGRSIRIDYGIRLADERYVNSRVEKIITHKSYVPSSSVDKKELFDLAVIVLTESLPTLIETAVVSPRTLRSGIDQVLFSGYGCEVLPGYMRADRLGEDVVVESSVISEQEQKLRLKVHPVVFLGYSSAIGRIENQQANIFRQAGSEFSGCPGDSGSGVYLYLAADKKPYLELVGINAFINPLYSAFTRLDSQAAGAVFSCLQMLQETSVVDQESCFIEQH